MPRESLLIQLFGADAVRERESRPRATSRHGEKENFGYPRTGAKSNSNSTWWTPIGFQNDRECNSYSIRTPERATTPGRDLVFPPLRDNRRARPDLYSNHGLPKQRGDNKNVPKTTRKSKPKFLPVRNTLASLLTLPGTASTISGRGNGHRGTITDQFSTISPRSEDITRSARPITTAVTTAHVPEGCVAVGTKHTRVRSKEYRRHHQRRRRLMLRQRLAGLRQHQLCDSDVVIV